MELLEEIEYQTVPLESLEPYPGNARRGNVDAIKGSLAHHGQYRPLVVQRSTMHILAGNHTYYAMAELDYETVKIGIVDVDDDQARRIVLADNKSSDDASYDPEALKKLLAEADDLAGTAWTQAQVDKLLAADDPMDEDDLDTSEQMSGLQFRVIVDADNEAHQANLIEKFEAEGLSARPLVS